MVVEHIHELARRGLNLYFCWIGLRSLIYEDGTKYAKKRGDGIDGRYSSPLFFVFFVTQRATEESQRATEFLIYK